MRIKIEMEMSGNQFLDLLRRVPKSIAAELLHSAVTISSGLPDKGDERDMFWKSAKEIIEAKKR